MGINLFPPTVGVLFATQVLATMPNFIRRPIYQYLLLGAITLLAVVLRFYKLGEWSFWGDELFTIRDAIQAANSPGYAGLTFELTSIAFNWFGISEWSARLVSALIGIVSVPVLYFPIRRAFDPAVALVATLFLAISPWHLYWSQNARFYTLILLLYTLALFAFYRGIEDDRPSYLVAAMLLIGLSGLERTSALLSVPVILTYLLLLIVLPIEKPKGLSVRNLAVLFVPGVLGVAYLAVPYMQNPEQQWVWIVSRVNNNPLWITAGIVYYIGVSTICMGGFGMLYLLSQRNRIGLLLGTGAIVPLLIIAMISMVFYAANRYIFISLACWLVLASVAVVALLRTAVANTRLLAIGVLLLLLFDPLSEDVLYYIYQNGNRDDWKGAFEVVQHNLREGDTVVASHALVGNYYMHEDTLNLYDIDLRKIDDLGERVWFVEDMNVLELAPDVHAWLEQEAQLVANRDVHVSARTYHMRVYLYESSRANKTPDTASQGAD